MKSTDKLRCACTMVSSNWGITIYKQNVSYLLRDMTCFFLAIFYIKNSGGLLDIFDTKEVLLGHCITSWVGMIDHINLLSHIGLTTICEWFYPPQVGSYLTFYCLWLIVILIDFQLFLFQNCSYQCYFTYGHKQCPQKIRNTDILYLQGANANAPGWEHNGAQWIPLLAIQACTSFAMSTLPIRCSAMNGNLELDYKSITLKIGRHI